MSRPAGIEAARDVLRAAITRRVFPGCVVHVGSSRATRWHEAIGRLSFDTDSAAAESTTWYDLASLTKPLATTTIILDLVSRGVVSLDEPVSRTFHDWRGADRADVTIADLLEHASGLPARFPAEPLPLSRDEWIARICRSPFDYASRTRALYSDLGFILMGMLAEDLDGASLDVLFARQASMIETRDGGAVAVSYGVPADARHGVAPTQPLPEDTRGLPRLVGEVHDNYAAALNGIAGHAGLFGTAAGVAAFAGALLRSARGIPELGQAFSPAMTRRATTRSTVDGSSRLLGWDGMLPTSSCGERMSASAFGHVGFTGTSLWIDPVRDRYFVLLTNRVCGDASTEDMRTVRRAFHDALADD